MTNYRNSLKFIFVHYLYLSSGGFQPFLRSQLIFSTNTFATYAKAKGQTHCLAGIRKIRIADIILETLNCLDYWDRKNIYMKMEDLSANEPEVTSPSYALPGT